MKISNFIEGLKILQPYYDDGEYVLATEHVFGEHDIFYAYATDKALSKSDIKKMHKLGWLQAMDDSYKNWEPKYYDPNESWMAYI